MVVAVSDTGYLLFGKNALSRTLPVAFPGLEIQDGKLVPHQGSPYIPPSYLISPVLIQALKLPSVNSTKIDSLIVIDTARPTVITPKVPMIMLKSTEVSLYLSDQYVFAFPYDRLLFGKRDFVVTEENVDWYLKRCSAGILIGYFFSSLLQDGLMLAFSVLFLALAAFVFRMERERKFIDYLKVSLHAITPIIVGGILVAISGVRVDWVWHLFVFLSTIVMFRAIVAVNNGAQANGSREGS